jgi:hypothetical protein
MCLYNKLIYSTLVHFRHASNLELQHNPTCNSTEDEPYNQYHCLIDADEDQACEQQSSEDEMNYRAESAEILEAK